MICRQIGDTSCKTYLLVSSKTKEAILVDPLLEKTAAYLELLKREGLRLKFVIDSHTHADHLSGGADLREKLDVPYLMHADSAARRVSRRVQDQEVLGVGDIRVTFLHTPGHTGDSVCLLLGDRLLTGDFLFIGSYGAGRLDLPGSDPAVHFDSLRKFDALPDNLTVLPAHDYQGKTESTLGAERKTNPVLSPRAREAYVQWWAGRRMGPAEWMKDVVKANMAGERDPHAVRIPKETAACACASAPAEEEGRMSEYTTIDVEQAEAAAQKPGIFILDARTPGEYADGHLKNAVLIPHTEVQSRAAELPPEKDRSILVYCAAGVRSVKACNALAGLGYKKLLNLDGGINAWLDAGKPVVQ